jgi:hypothetical protein
MELEETKNYANTGLEEGQEIQLPRQLGSSSRSPEQVFPEISEGELICGRALSLASKNHTINFRASPRATSPDYEKVSFR